MGSGVPTGPRGGTHRAHGSNIPTPWYLRHRVTHANSYSRTQCAFSESTLLWAAKGDLFPHIKRSSVSLGPCRLYEQELKRDLKLSNSLIMTKVPYCCDKGDRGICYIKICGGERRYTQYKYQEILINCLYTYSHPQLHIHTSKHYKFLGYAIFVSN